MNPFCKRSVWPLALVFIFGTPLFADRVLYHRVAIDATGDQPLVHVERAFEITSQPGMALGQIFIPESARVTMNHFAGTLFEGTRQDPAGKPNLQKQGSYSRAGIEAHDTWAVLVPGLKVGTRFEYRYTLVVSDLMFLPPITFDSAFAVEETRLTVTAKPGATFDFALFNPENLRYTTGRESRDGASVWTLELAALPAPESGNHAFRVHPVVGNTETGPGWGRIAALMVDLHENRDLQLLQDWLAEIKQHADETAKVRAAYAMVRDRIRYQAVNLGDHDYRAAPPRDVLRQGYGDCKDKSYLLLDLLGALGIESYPVLVAAEPFPWPQKTAPALTLFNHVIVAVPRAEGWWYLDPTAAALSADHLPAMDRGAHALLLQGEGRLLQLPTSPGDRVAAEVTGTVMAGTPATVTWDVSVRFEGNQTAVARAAWASGRDLVPDQPLRYLIDELLAPRLANQVAPTQADLVREGDALRLTFSLTESLDTLGEVVLVPRSPLLFYQFDLSNKHLHLSDLPRWSQEVHFKAGKGLAPRFGEPYHAGMKSETLDFGTSRDPDCTCVRDRLHVKKRRLLLSEAGLGSVLDQINHVNQAFLSFVKTGGGA
ncbi:transglutaminase domain-containing protein [Acanthopleuribacter pedis]|uniref:Transglutaminase-like domain-containing protein n=1 Tax=Acanthopleuribacter pedis TaxID=442870 RepID=A0A8J7U3G9_9BACT|nr:transglutaminase domain-containing protein [Acanthopleuribacter pedis]MBO1319622.1 hypothetical protein [Acanthopleuribacter pedis]